MADPLTNWAGNVRFGARTLQRPESVDELRRLVAGTHRIRALGTGHSFNAMADSPGDLVSVAGLPTVIDITTDADGADQVPLPTVTVSAGVRYGELSRELHARGFALRNLGSLPHISVAGACATGTHGSGVTNGNLARDVVALELVGPEGDLVTVDKRVDPDRFGGAVVALGALGIVTRLTLEIVPTFDVRQYVYEDLPGDELRAHTEEILGAGYSVSLFTNWQHDTVDQVWRKERIDPGAGGDGAHRSCDRTLPARWHGARRAEAARHPLPGLPATSCTEQLGRPGPWHTRLPHFRLEFTPSFGEELQAEYLLPRPHAAEALDAVAGLRDLLAPLLLVSEVRTVAADEMWLSPSYQRDCVALHFTWVNDEDGVRRVLHPLEERLAPWAARPHWGKLFVATPDSVASGYPRMSDFGLLRRELDPGGKFGGDLVDRYAPAAPA